MIALLVALLCQSIGDPGRVHAIDPATPKADPMARYLADLEKAGVLGGDQQPATLERLRGELAA